MSVISVIVSTKLPKQGWELTAKKIQVGLTKLKDPITQKRRPVKYSDLPNQKGWTDCHQYLPIPYDLMFVQVEGEKKPYPGWWNGEFWEGRLLKTTFKIIKWKRNMDYD